MLSSVIQEVIDGLLDIDILDLGAAMIDDMMGAYIFYYSKFYRTYCHGHSGNSL